MAQSYTTLQLALPATLAEANAWLEDANRIMSDADAELTVIEQAGGHYRLTVHREASANE